MAELLVSIPNQEIGMGKCPRSDLFCVEWVGRKTTAPSVNKKRER